MKTLAGQTALVTGAGQGIGLATGVALAQAGANVAFNYLEQPGEAAAAVETVSKAGGRALLEEADVADQRAVERMVDEVVAELGGLDIAVANAAFSDRGPFHELDMAGFRHTIDVTMWGALYVLRAAARQMIRQGRGGSIVVIGSPHAYIASPNSMPYNMAKAAVDQMARTAAIELAEHRIRVNILTPGWIDTPGERKFASDEELRAAGQRLPWKRLGTADEIARGVVFLCDPKSDYITGSSLKIDGGVTLPWWALPNR